MTSSRRDLFRVGGGNLLRKLAEFASGSLDRIACPPPKSADEAGHALRGLNLKGRSVPAFGQPDVSGVNPPSPHEAPAPSQPGGTDPGER